MHLFYKKRFLKRYKKLPKKIQEKTDDVLRRFIEEPMHADLRDHSLDDKFLGCRSIDVTGDYRIIFHDIGEGYYELVEIIDVGTHSQLYG